MIGECRYVNSDVQRFFIAEWNSSIIPIYSANNVISSYHWIYTPWYEIRLNTAVITYSQDLDTNNQNGLVYDEKITVSIPRSDNEKWKAISDLLLNKYIVVFQDANENWFTFGYRYGAQVRSYVLSENQYVISFDSPHANNLPTSIDDAYVLNNIFINPSPSATPSITPSITISPSITPSITRTPSPTASCARPTGLNTYTLFEAYNGITGSTNFKTTVEEACIAQTIWLTSGYTFSGAVMQAASMTIGEDAYYTYGPKCTKYPNGYYLQQLSGSTSQIIWINNDKIAGFPSCVNISPTPSTSATPTLTPSISRTSSITPTPTRSVGIVITSTPTPTRTPSASAVAFSYGVQFYSCSGGNCGIYIGTAHIDTTVPLTVGKYYYTTDGGAKSVYVTSSQPLGGTPLTINNGPYNTCNEACI